MPLSVGEGVFGATCGCYTRAQAPTNERTRLYDVSRLRWPGIAARPITGRFWGIAPTEAAPLKLHRCEGALFPFALFGVACALASPSRAAGSGAPMAGEMFCHRLKQFASSKYSLNDLMQGRDDGLLSGRSR
jgi:hypothetical protein